MLKLLGVTLLSLASSGMPIRANESVVELPDSHEVPKMITMNFYEDSASQMAFKWNTDYRMDTILQVSKVQDDFTSDIKEFSGVTEKSKVQNDGFLHSAVATNLEKNTKYYYRLGDKEANVWSEVGSFTTENNNSYTSFLHVSDPQVMESLHASTYNYLLESITGQHNLDFICVAGDLVNGSWADHTPKLEQWGWVLTEQAEYLQNIPTMTVAGNHEAADYDYSSRFNYPIEEQDVRTGLYYSYDYHDIHFTCLNTNDTLNKASATQATGLSEAQMTWIRNDLEKSKNAKWKIVMMHKGMYDAGGHCSNLEGEDYDIPLIRKQLSPLFSQYGIDVVLQGHDHLYSRSYPIEGVIENDKLVSKTKEEKVVEITHKERVYHAYQNPSGPIYVNTGSASGSKYYGVVDYNPNTIPLERAYGPNNRMLTSYYVENNQLFANVYEIVQGQLSLYDTFAISKGENKTDDNPSDENSHNEQSEKKVNKVLIISVVSAGVVALSVTLFFVLKKKGGKLNG